MFNPEPGQDPAGPATTDGGTAAGVAPTPPAGTGGEPQAGVAGDDLQARLEEQQRIQGGLDRRIAQLTQQLALTESEKKELTDQLGEARNATVGSTEELSEHKTRVTALEAKVGDLEAQLGVQQGDANRAKMVATEFPMLAPLLEAGGLPPFEDAEAYRGKLTGIVTAMNLSARTQVLQQMEGVKPPATPPATTAVDRDALWGEMLAASQEGDEEKSKELREQWFAEPD